MFPYTPGTPKPFGSTKKPGQRISKRKSTSIYSPSVWSPLHTPVAPYTSKNQSFNQSFQSSHVIVETGQHVLGMYGTVMPVHVTEALTLTERGTHVSVKLSDTGWAWLVCGRRLLVWKYKEFSGARNFVSQCRELTLPPSDLAHKADLVCIMENESQSLSVIAVSPEGVVRYWPNFAHDGSSVEVAADLQGQECYSLTNAQPLGYILGTTTGTLVLITATSYDGQNSVVCRTLKIPQGMLAGFGRRVSSFIFGAMPAQSSETKPLVKILVEDGDFEEEKYLYVLAGCTLQKRQLRGQGIERLVSECDLDRPIRDGFLETLWSRENTHPHQIQTWIIDAWLTSQGILILTAGLNRDVSLLLHFAVGLLEIPETMSVVSISKFTVLQHTEQYRENEEEQLLGCKILVPKPNNQLVYVYNNSRAICVSFSEAAEDVDVVEFNRMGDKILGAGVCEGYPLFFTNKCGIVALMHNQSANDDFSRASSMLLTSEISLMTSESKDDHEDKVSRLRSALLLFFQNDTSRCQAILEEIFPSSLAPEADSVIDVSVASLSREIIDDFPASDPRWAESVPVEMTGSSNSVVIMHQLADKLKSHECLLTFLKDCGLWERLCSVTVRGQLLATNLLLSEHAEKLTAAMALRKLHTNYNDILEVGIKKALQTREDKMEHQANLTSQDVFYRQVSCIEDIFPALVEQEKDQLFGEITPQDAVTLVSSINQICLMVFQEAYHYRQANCYKYDLDGIPEQGECMPWTSTTGPEGIRTVLIKQCMMTTENALPVADDVQTRGTLFQQLVDLVDLVLEGYRYQLHLMTKNTQQHVAVEKKYQNDRKQLIRPFLEMQQFERAAALAEKYHDFDTLVTLCETIGDKERLHRYIMQFANEGFSQFAFSWYLEKGKRGKLLSQLSSYSAELDEFLKHHDMLQWLHQIHTKQYGDAQKTLQALAHREENYLSKKKTLLSLSKLALIASDQPAEVKQSELDAIDSEQELILYQETLPASVMDACGLDPDTMRVLKPEDLIEMYISDENSSANEYDFKKAFELLSFIKKPSQSTDVEELRTKIWCKAILRDSWEDLQTDTPLESIKDTIFFRVLELAFTQGVDMHEFLPPLDQLLQSPELAPVANKKLNYLLKAGYEHIQRLVL